MQPKRTYDSTVARIAGNLLSSGAYNLNHELKARAVEAAVGMARAIVAEVKRTEPEE